MSYQKQPYLSGAYYGPPVPPPPSSSYQRRGRGCCAKCGCCISSLLCDCGCCLLGCVFKIILSVLVVAGLIVLLLWLLIRPHFPKAVATGASLFRFNYSSADSQLYYDLSVNITVRNPNSHLGFYCDVVRASAIYEGQRFATKELSPFYQGTKNTTDFGPVVFRGQNAIVLGAEQTGDYQSQKSDGTFRIDVNVDLKVRFKLGIINTGKLKLNPKIKCRLNVPLIEPISRNKSNNLFQTTVCDYHLFW